jgi:hypothetical protein
MAFFDGKHLSNVKECWTEICKSVHFGTENLTILIAALQHICAKVDGCRNTCLLLTSCLASVSAADVIVFLTKQLSSTAFPWSQDNTPNSTKQLIQEYTTTLCLALGISEQEATQDYSLNCRAAALLLSELLIQHFSVCTPSLPVLLQFSILHMPFQLTEDSTSTLLLKSMIEGTISMVTKNNKSSKNTAVQDKIKKLLSWYEVQGSKLDWDLIQKEPEKLPFMIHISYFLDTLLCIFEGAHPLLLQELLEENSKWACEGFLSPEMSLKAIKLYTLLLDLLKKQIQFNSTHFLLQRLLDQLTILNSLDAELKTLVNKHKSIQLMHTIAHHGTDKWSLLPPGKQTVKQDAEAVMIAVSQLQQVCSFKVL